MERDTTKGQGGEGDSGPCFYPIKASARLTIIIISKMSSHIVCLLLDVLRTLVPRLLTLDLAPQCDSIGSSFYLMAIRIHTSLYPVFYFLFLLNE